MDSAIIKEEMLQYFSRLNEAEQQSVLEMIKTFIQSRKTEFGPVTLEEYNQELEAADNEIENGNYVTHDEVKKRYTK
ncbi:MAG: hypothetical protein WDN26_12025 [Chitinophagaceae bacterium]